MKKVATCSAENRAQNAYCLQVTDSFNLQLSLFHGISAVLLLIATAIIAADAADFPSKFCDYIRKSPYYSTTCATYEAAVVCKHTLFR